MKSKRTDGFNAYCGTEPEIAAIEAARKAANILWQRDFGKNISLEHDAAIVDNVLNSIRGNIRSR